MVYLHLGLRNGYTKSYVILAFHKFLVGHIVYYLTIYRHLFLMLVSIIEIWVCLKWRIDMIFSYTWYTFIFIGVCNIYIYFFTW